MIYKESSGNVIAKSKKQCTISEKLYSPDFLKQVFPTGNKKFYFVLVEMDQLEIVQTPPDVYSMAYETGLSLVGIGVALNTYIQMLNSGTQTYFLPHYYFNQQIPKKYLSNESVTFNALSALLSQIAIDMYESGYYIAAAGGGLSYYISAISDQLEQVSLAQIKALDVLSKLYKAREFTFIETHLNDPTYGNLLFNNAKYMKDNTNFSDNPDVYYNINQNIFNPQRFESQMSIYATKYDISTSKTDIYKDNNLKSSEVINDYLTILQNSKNKVTGFKFSWNISEKRSYKNILLRFTNKSKNKIDSDLTTSYWLIKGETNLTQFFRSASQFIQQPYITNYLYQLYLVDTNQATERNSTLYPTQFTIPSQLAFIQYYISMYNYGNPLGSGMWSITKSLSSTTSQSIGVTYPC